MSFLIRNIVLIILNYLHVAQFQSNIQVGGHDRRGLNALHYAAIYERAALVDVCLAAIDCAVTGADRAGNTALHYAVTAADTHTARRLIAAAVRYRFGVDTPNRQGVTPLIQACKLGHAGCARLLRELGRADETARDAVERRTAAEWEDYRGRHAAAAELDTPGARRSERVAAKRVRSAPPLLHRRYRKVLARPEPAEQTPAVLGKAIHSASEKDPHNRVEYIVDVSPLECFASRPDFSRRRSTLRDLCRRPAAGDLGAESASWRGEMRRLYRTFDFQFTSSYLRAATVRMPSVLRDGDPPLSQSPSPAQECPSEAGTAVSERGLAALGRRVLRKNSALMLFKPDNRPRRNSILGGSRQRRYSGAASPSELATDGGDDAGRQHDDAAAAEGSSKPCGPTHSAPEPDDTDPPSRPASRTGYYQRDSAPTAPAADHLDAIRENQEKVESSE